MRTVLQLVLINDTGDSYYRMRWPGAALARKHPDWRVINLAANAKERLPWALSADLLILFQSQDFDLLPILQERQKRGLKTIVEYNDNFYEPPAWSPVAQPWSSPLLWQSYETIMNVADSVMVTGSGLADLFAPQTKTPICAVRNYFPRALEPFETVYPNPEEEIRIGWAGSLGHMADVLALGPIFERLVAKDPRVRIHLMGNETLPTLFHLPPDRVRFTPWGTMDQYFEFWRPTHIGLAPLLDTGYNRCRSDIKAIEIAACGALPLVQQLVPYQEFLRDVEMPGFDTLGELEQLLEGYLQNPSLIEQHARRCYDYVGRARLEDIHSDRSTLYQRFLPETSPQPNFGQSPPWPAEPGYYELEGTPEPQTQSSTVLVQVQTLWNQNKRQEALNLVLNAVHANPLNPDWSIACAKCLAIIQHPTLTGRIEAHRNHFPRDIRIDLIEITATAEADARKVRWTKLFERLEREPASRNAFQTEVLRLFANDLKRYEDYLELAISVARLYPNSPEIRLPLAEILERQGNYREALIHFDWLNRAQDNFENAKSFFQSADRGYSRAWSAALRARSEN